jgi:spore germination protein YaaH
VFFDDHRTLLEKLRLYQAREVNAVSFWRIGQGPPLLWSSIENAGSGNGSAPGGSGPTVEGATE